MSAVLELARNAADSVTRPEAQTFNVAVPDPHVETTIVARDWSQSRFGNLVDPAHPKLLKLYQLAGEFNRARETSTDLRIRFIEGGGAQKQVDVYKAGRPPLESYRKIHQVLDPDIGIRILVRSSYYNATTPFHVDDLDYQIELDAKACGAPEGRAVFLKDFDAQNFGPNIVNLLIAASRVRKRTGWDIRIELAQSYTADAKYSPEKYAEVARELFLALQNNEIDLSMIEGVSSKDMIGMLNGKSKTPQEGNSAKVTEIQMRAVQDVKRKDLPNFKPRYVAIHTHEAGHAVEANATAIDGFHELKQSNNVVADGFEKIIFDGIPSGRGFGDDEAIVDSHKTKSVTMNPRQRTIWAEMSEIIIGLEELHKDYLIDESKWPGVWRSYSFVPGGAAPSIEDFAIKPMMNEWVATAETFAIHPMMEELVRQGVVKDKDTAENIARYVFLEINRQLAYDAGLPNSVTPGMLFFTHLTREIAIGMIKDGFVAKHVPNLGMKLVDRVPDPNYADNDWRLSIPTYYKHMNHAVAMEYFRGKMPFSQSGNFLEHVRRKHFQNILPFDIKADDKGHSNSAIRDLISPENYEEVRTKLIDRPNAPASAIRELFPDADPFLVDDFMARHTGINMLPVDAEVNRKPPLRPEIEAKVDKLELEGKLNIPRDDAIVAFYSDPSGVQAALLCERPATDYPTSWPAFIDPTDRAPEQIALIREMAKYNVDNPIDLRNAKTAEALRDSQRYAQKVLKEVDELIRRFDGALHLLNAGVREGCPDALCEGMQPLSPDYSNMHRQSDMPVFAK